MRVLDNVSVLKELAKALNKPCMLAEFGHYDIHETLKAAPWIDIEKDGQILADGAAFIICETEEELQKIYYQTVGDDGPTNLNSYNGPAKVYALTCDCNGDLKNENT